MSTKIALGILILLILTLTGGWYSDHEYLENKRLILNDTTANQSAQIDSLKQGLDAAVNGIQKSIEEKSKAKEEVTNAIVALLKEKKEESVAYGELLDKYNILLKAAQQMETANASLDTKNEALQNEVTQLQFLATSKPLNSVTTGTITHPNGAQSQIFLDSH